MEREEAIRYMQDHMTNNKAMGLLAQSEFEKWAMENPAVKPKYFSGCWIASPKGFTSSRRVCFLIHSKLEMQETLRRVIEDIVSKRAYHALFGALSRSGLGVIYCIPVGSRKTDFAKIDWHLFRYENETLKEIDPYAFFNNWPGSRGRASRGREWSEAVNNRYESLDMHLLEPLVLNQIFYNSYIKGVFKKPLSDPYDTDSFIVSYEGKIFPVEIKEKFPFLNGKRKMFGLDAGRLLMLLRICLPLDYNGLYIIREVEKDTRQFLGWKMMTLDSLIMNSNWNLQAGGRGMLGGMTQTITFPYELFSNLSVKTFSEDNLHEISKLSERVKRRAAKFYQEVQSLFVNSKGQTSIS